MPTIEVVPLSEYNWSLSRIGPFPFSPAVIGLIAGFYGTTIWMAIEMNFQIYFTFKRHRGLYFWAILITAWGVALHALGFLLKQFDPACPRLLAIRISKIGWMCNVTGFATVLYSRLHLVVRNRLLLRLVLGMIITHVITLHIPLNVTELGPWFAAKPNPTRPRWEHAMQIIERMQATGFTIQENIISPIYVYQMRKFLRAGYNNQTHKVILLFVATQLIAVTLDLCLAVLCYVDMFYLKVAIPPFAYAVKLRLEFIVLNELLNLIRHRIVPGNFSAPDDRYIADAEFSTGPRIRSTIFSEKTSGHQRSSTGLQVNLSPVPNARGVVETQEYDVEVSWGKRYSPRLDLVSKTPDLVPDTAPRSANIITSSSNSDASTLTGGHAATSDIDQISEDSTLSELERQYLGRFFLP